MLWVFIKFYLGLFSDYFVAPHYHQQVVIDDQHSHYRRFTARYKKKQGVVKNFWIAAGLITLMFPLLHVAIIISMLTTFASFSVLDESE